MPKSVPDGFHSVTPHLIVKDAARAIEFYKKAFGAEEMERFPMPDGRVMHACIKIGDSPIFLADEFPEHGCGLAPTSLEQPHATIHLFVDDVDKSFERAIKAGAKEIMKPQDQFWGDRYGRIVDPFGQPWSLATHKEDLTPKEMEKRASEFFKEMAGTRK